MRQVVGLLILLPSLSGTPAFADLFRVNLTISFSANPPSVIPIDAQLAGTARFYTEIPPENGQPQFILQDAIDTGPISEGGTFTASDYWQVPCREGGSCPLDFSFVGTVGQFPASGWPDQNPGDPGITIMQLFDFAGAPPEVFSLGKPCPPGVPCDRIGRLMAFDAPIVVGSWEVQVSKVPEPSNWAEFATALVLLVLFESACCRPW